MDGSHSGQVAAGLISARQILRTKQKLLDWLLLCLECRKDIFGQKGMSLSINRRINDGMILEPSLIFAYLLCIRLQFWFDSPVQLTPPSESDPPGNNLHVQPPFLGHDYGREFPPLFACDYLSDIWTADPHTAFSQAGVSARSCFLSRAQHKYKNPTAPGSCLWSCWLWMSHYLHCQIPYQLSVCVCVAQMLFRLGENLLPATTRLSQMQKRPHLKDVNRRWDWCYNRADL